MPGRAAKPVDAADLLHERTRPKWIGSSPDQHMVRLELLGIIGESFYGLRENAAAAEVLEEALREAAGRARRRCGAGTAPAAGACRRPTNLSAARRIPVASSQIVLDAYGPGGRPPDPELIEARLHEATLDYYEARYPQAHRGRARGAPPRGFDARRSPPREGQGARDPGRHIQGGGARSILRCRTTSVPMSSRSRHTETICVIRAC